MRTVITLLVIAAGSGLATVAKTADLPSSTKAAPVGPGTEASEAARARGIRAVEGWQGSVQLGSGFTDTYGFGLGGRVGYTMNSGIYVGGDVTHYFGHTVETPAGSESAHATFLGGELGYKLFLDNHRWEVRPYVFVGPGFIRTVADSPVVRTESTVRLAVQPGLLAAYHFGTVFLSAEAKIHLTPDPTGLSLFAGAGMGL